MNAADIQNALDRIIKQNRNLDESGLRVLLLASSWENEDIEKAVGVFKERKDKVLSSLSSEKPQPEKKVINLSDNGNIEDVQVLDSIVDEALSSPDIAKIIDEVKTETIKEENQIDTSSENNKKDEVSNVDILEEKPEIEDVVDKNTGQIVLKPQSKTASLSDLLSSSVKELDKIPDKVFEDKRSKGIDLETAPLLVKNDGVTPVNDLKKEAIKNILDGKKVKPLPQTASVSLVENEQKINNTTKQETKTDLKKEEIIKEIPKDSITEKPKETADIKKDIEKTEDKKSNTKESLVLIQSAEAPSDHLIPDEEEMEKEKLSLVENVNDKEVSKKTFNKIKEEIPHNLPLKPFDESPHVVPFSEYKEIFHGKEDDVPKSKEEVKVVQKEQTPINLINNHEPVIIRNKKQIPLSKSEKELVFMASVLLFVILLMLSYMYSNGRL